MRFLNSILGAVVAVAVTLGTTAPAQAIGRLVYMGADPSCHFEDDPEGVTLARNAVQWTGRASDPAILAVNADCDPTPLLAAAGFSNVTTIGTNLLASTNLSVFAVVYVGPFPDVTGDLVPAAPNVQNFVSNGGGLVVEPETDDPASWSWVPFGSLIGASIPNLCPMNDTVAIVAPTHPVMAGLSDVGLSNWGCSIHSNFATPQAAKFETLTVDPGGVAHIIAREGSPPAVAPAASAGGIAGLVLLLLGGGLYSLRRMPARAPRSV